MSLCEFRSTKKLRIWASQEFLSCNFKEVSNSFSRRCTQLHILKGNLWLPVKSLQNTANKTAPNTIWIISPEKTLQLWAQENFSWKRFMLKRQELRERDGLAPHLSWKAHDWISIQPHFNWKTKGKLSLRWTKSTAKPVLWSQNPKFRKTVFFRVWSTPKIYWILRKWMTRRCNTRLANFLKQRKYSPRTSGVQFLVFCKKKLIGIYQFMCTNLHAQESILLLSLIHKPQLQEDLELHKKRNRK